MKRRIRKKKFILTKSVGMHILQQQRTIAEIIGVKE